MFMRTSIRNAKSVVQNRCNERNAGVRGCSQDFRFKTCEWKVLSHRPKVIAGAVQVCRLRGREAGNRRLCIIELPAIKNFEYGILEK